MAGIFQHVRPYDLFDSTTLTILDQAYDRALASIENRKNTIAVRELIAVRMLDLASKGERDPDRLCLLAVGGIA